MTGVMGGEVIETVNEGACAGEVALRHVARILWKRTRGLVVLSVAGHNVVCAGAECSMLATAKE